MAEEHGDALVMLYPDREFDLFMARMRRMVASGAKYRRPGWVARNAFVPTPAETRKRNYDAQTEHLRETAEIVEYKKTRKGK